MFDGPVDAIWIENMNTVLDDNKKLCLNSGQIISLTPRMTMMFEVEDLSVASPATVSRCGMVYMEPESIGLKPYFISWLNTLPEKVCLNEGVKQQFEKFGNELLEDGCYFVRHDIHEPVKTVDNNLIQSTFRIVDSYLKDYIETEIKKVLPDKVEDLLSMAGQIFCFAVIWSIGCTTDLAGRKKFDTYMREKLKKLGIEFPEEKLVYDYYFDRTTKTWVNWFDTVPEYNVDIQTSYSEIVVPTLDSIRMKYHVKNLLTSGGHVMIPGPTGTGKSVNTFEMLTYEMPEEYTTLTRTFSAQTSANQVQDYLDDKFEKRRKGVYGPPVGKKNIVFIDDLNMPKKETYGAQPPLELIRQYLDHKGWFDRKSKEKPFNKIEDTYILAAMGPPGGGRSVITGRLQRHFNVMTYTDLEFESIEIIFNKIIGAFLHNFNKEIKDSIPEMISMTLRVYDHVLNGPLKPTPNKSHYTFNLRDISRISQGICNADNKKCIKVVDLTRIWVHENTRVFGDRLIDQKDGGWLQKLLSDEACGTFKLDIADVFNAERIIFGDYVDGIDTDTRIYQQITDLKSLVQKVIEFLEEYNGSVKQQMHLVMFLDAVDHVSRISRVIRQPLGNCLLLGIGGSGRQSLSRLATFMATYKLFQIEVIKGYGMPNWRDDVKKCLLQAGAENK